MTDGDDELAQYAADQELNLYKEYRDVIGLFRYASYGALAVMHFYTLTRRWEGFLDPFAINDKGFPINRNQVIDLAVMAAFIALLMMIARDHWSVGGWLRRKMGARWWQYAKTKAARRFWAMTPGR